MNNLPTILGIIGLCIIVVAWIVQIIKILGKSKSLSLFFVWLHLIGILTLVIASIGFDSMIIVIFTIILAILVIITILLYPKKKITNKKEPKSKD